MSQFRGNFMSLYFQHQLYLIRGNKTNFVKAFSLLYITEYIL
jgi:hypothetical protein